ncbi:hypothetical protein ACFLZ9_01010 [Patescibacteria group bacterium]
MEAVLLESIWKEIKEKFKEKVSLIDICDKRLTLIFIFLEKYYPIINEETLMLSLASILQKLGIKIKEPSELCPCLTAIYTQDNKAISFSMAHPGSVINLTPQFEVYLSVMNLEEIYISALSES